MKYPSQLGSTPTITSVSQSELTTTMDKRSDFSSGINERGVGVNVCLSEGNPELGIFGADWVGFYPCLLFFCLKRSCYSAIDSGAGLKGSGRGSFMSHVYAELWICLSAFVIGSGDC